MKHDLIQFPDRTRPEMYRQPVTLTRAELEHYRRRAHALRSDAFARLFKSAATGLGRTVRALYGGLKESHDRRRAISELRRLSDRTLADIGIDRSQIPYVVDRMLERRKADGDSSKTYPLRELTASANSAASYEDDPCCPPLAA